MGWGVLIAATPSEQRYMGYGIASSEVRSQGADGMVGRGGVAGLMVVVRFCVLARRCDVMKPGCSDSACDKEFVCCF
jgi:hypothetical protein